MYNNILIIDDSILDRMLAERVIIKNAFASTVQTVSSVREGLMHLESLTGKPDKLPEIIILDINMPEMDGFDFLDNYLQLPEKIQKRCTIFMLSASLSPNDHERVKKYPVVRKLLKKPFLTDLLKEIC